MKSFASLSYRISHFTFLLLIVGATLLPCIAGTARQLSRSRTVPDTDSLTRFLLQYSPVQDITDHDTVYFRNLAEGALRARREMPWGDSVPVGEFMHFVLPARVNNEYLDDSRDSLYRMLSPQIRNLSSREAILEVNHWLHSRVTYRPSDARTSSPLSTISQATGRCGEESTLAVAALRAVGIPARQVYTPRWAHTDDNHAWVEAWADGRWWFLGACEPEPKLNMAWFNLPASRGLLMHTRAFGPYSGSEEMLEHDEISTDINVTANYAPVGRMDVMVTDSAGNPVENAVVNFCIYNYAELHPVVSRLTDAGGRAALTAGLGDMVAWASRDGRYGFAKINATMPSPVRIILASQRDSDCCDLDICPPRASGSLPQASEEETAINNRRKAQEDSIRAIYTASFADSAMVRTLSHRLDVPEEALSCVLLPSRGNHLRLTEYLLSLSHTPERLRAALRILGSLDEKDKRDINPAVIDDILEVAAGDCFADTVPELALRYVYAPRIWTEQLLPVRTTLKEMFTSAERARFQANPALLARWVGSNITVDNSRSREGLYSSPLAVMELRRGDTDSRDNLFITAARTLGIPARINAVTGNLEYHYAGDWQPADLSPDYDVPSTTNLSLSPSASALSSQLSANYTTLHLLTDSESRDADPAYYHQFTLSRIIDGIPQLLEYSDGNLSSLTDTDGLLTLLPGDYVLTTGRRLSDGSVLARLRFFKLSPADTVAIPLEIRCDDSRLQVTGNFDAESLFSNQHGELVSVLSAAGRGYYALLYLTPGNEPSEHILNELRDNTAVMEASGRPLLAIYPSGNAKGTVELHGLPRNVIVGEDSTDKIGKDLKCLLKSDSEPWPVIMIADSFNRVVHLSSGYTIGSARRIAEIFHRLNNE